MAEKPLVSVIIITYKRKPEILFRAIESARNQTYTNQEILVVNDSPESIELEKEIRERIQSLQDDRIRYIVHEKNAGACKARNTGILAAKGQYIALLDDDDEWLPEKTEQQLKGFIRPETGMVYSSYVEQFLSGKERKIVSCTKSGDLFENLLYTNCLGGCSMSMFRKEVFDKVGLFDEKLLALQDYEMWIRIAEQYQIQYVEGPLIRKYASEDAITFNFDKKQQGFSYTLEKQKDMYKKYPKALNSRLIKWANFCLKYKKYRLFFQLWLKAVKAYPFSAKNITIPVKGFARLIVKRGKL